MFDAEADALSMYSRDSRMPSLIMQEGMSMQEYYAALSASQAQAYPAGQPGARPRRNSGTSIMSDTERLYGWSGSKGGVSNSHQAPRYRINSAGKLILADDAEEAAKKAALKKEQETAAAESALSARRPILKTARSEGQKPMYRPAFAPSADLPPSDDENPNAQPNLFVVANSGAKATSASEGEDSDLDRPIQHDLPAGRPLKARTSLKQKLGSVLARVGSTRKTGSTPPAISVSPSKDGSGVAQDYISVKRSNTTGGTSPGGLGRRPILNRGNSSKLSTRKESSLDEKAEDNAAESAAVTPSADSLLPAAPILKFNDATTPPVDNANDPGRDDVLLSADGGIYQGGFAGLARKLSRRATTGGAGSSKYRSRSAGREDRERKTDAIFDKAAAEAMLRDMAEIPLYRPPRSANVPNRRPLSSFPPRAPLQATGEPNSLANAPRYNRPAKSNDGPRKAPNTSEDRLTRATTVAAGHGRDYSSYKNRARSGSTPSTFSTFSSASNTGLLGGAKSPGRDSDIPPVPPVPELVSNAPQKKDWTQFSTPESTTDIAKQA